jgi:hypothetical protein
MANICATLPILLPSSPSSQKQLGSLAPRHDPPQIARNASPDFIISIQYDDDAFLAV